MSIFPDDFYPTYDDYVTKFLEYEEQGESTLWDRGDLLVEFTEQVTLEKVTEAGRRKGLRSLASDVMRHHKTLERWRYTAERFPENTRVLDLSFSHHTAAAYSKDPGRWIQEAADKEWSLYQLREVIKAAEHPEEAWVSKKIIGTAKVLASHEKSICLAGDDFELAWDVKKDDPLLEIEVVEVEASIRVRKA